MEGLVLTLLIAAVPLVFLVSLGRRSRRYQRWREAAAAVQMAVVEKPGLFTTAMVLPPAERGGLSVRLETYRRDKQIAGTRVIIQGVEAGLGLRPEGVGSTIRKAMGGREVELGDPAFDEEVYVTGWAPLAQALLDKPTRDLARRLLSGELELHRGDVLPVQARVADGSLVVDIPDSPGFLSALKGNRPKGEERLPDALRAALAIAGRLRLPAGGIPARIAENLRHEPLANVRLRCLRSLIREFPAHPATRDALLAARQDPNARVRLQAGIALGPEGAPVLLDLTSDPDDSTSAQAVEALADHLPPERLQSILLRAADDLRGRTAVACADALGWRKVAGAVETLITVLRGKDPGRWSPAAAAAAAAAARALGEIGLPEVEPPLLDALRCRSPEVQVAAAEALGLAGTVRAVPLLREAEEGGDAELCRAVRQAVAAIRSRLPGAEGGRLSLAGNGNAGRLSLAAGEAGGRLTLSPEEAAQRSPPVEAGETAPDRAGPARKRAAESG